MNLSTIRSVLLALLLLLGQLGWSAHSLTHFHTQPDGGVPAAACEWCHAYSNLDGPAPPPAAPGSVKPPPPSQPPILTVAESGAPQRLAYRSQAPPLVS
ncbi:MAG TPA: hypothetical protein VEY69_14710 [Lautropia sp.]|nr:hypothetical protein [Lautropia sp.]